MCEGEGEVTLAEKTHRLKWTSDPRNTNWSNDRSRYGYRMLEQMGWHEGKGLGVNEDGQKEHIKISKKSDKSGIGAVRDRDCDWIACQDSFNDILSELNSLQEVTGVVTDNKKSINSLVSTAGKSRKIVYHKFLKSKDLSMKTSNDLDCVFGKKKNKKKKTRNEYVKSIKDASPNDSLCSSSCSGLQTVKSELSIQDYFKQKMKKL